MTGRSSLRLRCERLLVTFHIRIEERGIFALLNASTLQEQAIGFVAVLLGAGNVAGGYAVTERMLAMFKTSDHATKRGGKPGAHKHIPAKKG